MRILSYSLSYIHTLKSKHSVRHWCAILEPRENDQLTRWQVLLLLLLFFCFLACLSQSCPWFSFPLPFLSSDLGLEMIPWLLSKPKEKNDREGLHLNLKNSAVLVEETGETFHMKAFSKGKTKVCRFAAIAGNLVPSISNLKSRSSFKKGSQAMLAHMFSVLHAGHERQPRLAGNASETLPEVRGKQTRLGLDSRFLM